MGTFLYHRLPFSGSAKVSNIFRGSSSGAQLSFPPNFAPCISKVSCAWETGGRFGEFLKPCLSLSGLIKFCTKAWLSFSKRLIRGLEGKLWSTCGQSFTALANNGGFWGVLETLLHIFGLVQTLESEFFRSACPRFGPSLSSEFSPWVSGTFSLFARKVSQA